MPQQADTSKTRSNQPPQGSKGPGAETPANEAVDNFKAGMARSAHELSTEVAHVASDVAGQARHVAEAKLHEGKNFAGDQLGAVAAALRSTSNELRSKDSAITDYVASAAGKLDDVSVYLGTRTLAQLISDVEGFARREPAVFLGGAFFAGLLGGRFLKAATPSLRSSPPQVGTMRGAATAPSGFQATKDDSPTSDASKSDTSRNDTPRYEGSKLAAPKTESTTGPSASTGARDQPGKDQAGNGHTPSTSKTGTGPGATG